MPYAASFLLPVDEPPQRPRPTLAPGDAAGEKRVAEGAMPLVLVVDDDLEVCTYLRLCLKPLTQRVLEAGDGLEAVDLIRTHPDVRLVIADVVMPRMDGLALKATIEADEARRSLAVLLITGDSLPVRDGPILRKPFNARTLRAVVQALLAG